MDTISVTTTAYEISTAANNVGTKIEAKNAVPPECQGLLVILVGPAGVGKNTIMQRAINALPQMSQMPTATTRAPRSNEQHGREHWFVSLEQFRAMIAANELVEHQEVHPGRFYGTPRQQLFQALSHDHAWLIADIDIAGADALRKALPANTVLIFIEPPDMETLHDRIQARGQASEAEIQERMARVPRELAFAAQCDYRVLNTDLDKAAQQVIAIIRDEAQRRHCE